MFDCVSECELAQSSAVNAAAASFHTNCSDNLTQCNEMSFKFKCI